MHSRGLNGGVRSRIGVPIYGAISILLMTACAGSSPAPTPSAHESTSPGRVAVPTAPPFKAGRTFECPGGFEYPGYADHLFYPPGHPAIPAGTIRPVECFVTAGDARTAGYRLAPLPPSDREIGGIYLVPASHAVTERCRRAARRAGFSVPCPGFVPSTGSLAGVFARRGSFEFEWDFAGPPGYVGIPGGAPSNHLFIIAARGGMVFGGMNEFAMCPGAVNFGKTRVLGMPATLLACVAGGSGLNSGHIVVRWRTGGVTYEVSLHNPSKVNQRLAVTIARSVGLASP